jgi:hypothetical protein
MLMVTIVIAGWIAVCAVVRSMLARNSARLRQEFQQQIDLLAARFGAEQSVLTRPSAAPEEPANNSVNAIAAAAAALAVKKVHVRAVQPAETRPSDPWAQQGRAGVWSAHDIAQRGH